MVGGIVILVLISSATLAADDSANCPSLGWAKNENVPACPPGDNTKLPENYPAMAYVVSDDSTDSRVDDEFTASVVEKIFEGSEDQVPLVLLPVQNSTLKYLDSQLEVWAARRTSSPVDQRRLVAKWRGAMKAVPGPTYTWQQDYFETFVDPKTGNPTFREIGDYRRAGDALNHLAGAAGSTCPEIKMGERLPPASERNYRYGGGHSGGNIEALPAGLCLHGDTQKWDDFVKHYCGSRSNEVEVNTAWLNVGHVDEVIGVVKKPGAQPPCDFAITLASPSKALQLLEENRNDRFLDIDYSKTDDPNSEFTRAFGLGTVRGLCNEVVERRGGGDNQTPSPRNKPSSSGRRVSYLLDALGLDARQSWAGVALLTDRPHCGSNKTNLGSVTNGEVAEALRGSDRLAVTNRLVQIEMDRAKAKIADRLKERLPACQVTFIELPQLFYGGMPVEREGVPADAPIEQRYELPKKMAKSILPNASNALPVGNAIISPHPKNSAFAKYMDEEYRRAGLKHSFVDTFRYAHVGDGNLHCTTHKIPFCRPR